MQRPVGPVIRNSKGQPILLSAEEQYHADKLQLEVDDRFKRRNINSLGYEINITTLTTISKKISEQKFFETPPADYLPVVVGASAWSTNITTYRSFDVADEFETGVVNTGSQNGRLAVADAGVDSVNLKVFNWGKTVNWNIFDLEFAAKSGNWDLVTAKERARKKNWDLGIQRIAFLGSRGQNSSTGFCTGLLNQSGATVDTTTLTAPISGLSTTDLKTFVTRVVEVYRSNVNRTAWPTHFIIPESDYNGLAGQASAQFPIKSTLALLEEAFALVCRNKNFKILPLAYADAAYHADVTSIAGKQVYTLLNYDEESLKMEVPVPYTNTLANSVNNFDFQNVGYGQFTGVVLLRPLELYYFQY